MNMGWYGCLIRVVVMVFGYIKVYYYWIFVFIWCCLFWVGVCCVFVYGLDGRLYDVCFVFDLLFGFVVCRFGDVWFVFD